MNTQQPNLGQAEAKDVHYDSVRLPRAVQDILDDKESFHPKLNGQLTAVDILSTTERLKCKSSTKFIGTNLKGVQEWLDSPVDTTDQLNYTMRLLICPHHHKSSSAYPFTMDKDAMEYIVEKMNLPNSYISLVPQHNGRYIRIYGPKSEGIILHMRNPGFSFIATYKHTEQLIHGLILGIPPDDITKLVDDIETSDLTCWPPAMVSVCLLELKSTWIDLSSTMCYKNLQKTEKEIGTFTDYLMNKVNRDQDWLQQLDTETLAGDLTIISTSVARADHLCSVAQKMLEVVEEAYQAYLNAIGHLPESRKLSSRAAIPNATLLTRISELRSSFNVLSLEGQFYLRRTEANRQTIYSLIAQKDNNMSLQISQTNLGIAETNYADNQIMMRIADANTRDSAAMVIISVVTIAFLPGTFVSSLFSTTIFNFQAPKGTAVVSESWHGIYWAITAPLTIVILACGYIFWRMRRAHDRKQITKDQEELRHIKLTYQRAGMRLVDPVVGTEMKEKNR
jgi:Mg2+ and Co2+ transporter CorA